MVESKRISPHVHTVYKVDMTRIVHHRDRRKAAFEQRHGIKLTYMPYRCRRRRRRAAQRYPVVNASLESGAAASPSATTRTSISASLSLSNGD